MSFSGFENEDKIIEALNGKNTNELNKNLQKLIKESFSNYQGTIEAIKQAGQNKSDLKIIIGSESHTYSIKKGSGNSVHQEPIEQFLSFLDTNYKISENLKNDIRFFIWGDGTFDGNGNKEDRLDQNQLKKDCKPLLERINIFFSKTKDDLIQRFVFDGATTSIHSAEFIYFGTEKKGICIPAKNAFDLISKNKSTRAAVSVGVLSFQAWNRAIKKDSKSEHRRGQIQLKLGSLETLVKRRNKGTKEGTKEGTAQEIEFVKTLNQKRDLSYWHTLNLDPNHHYAIRVITKKYGKLNELKVLPKADAFIAKGHVDNEYLDSKEGFLDEKDMQKFNLQPINHSGISIKRADSKQYQIMKMSPSTFKKLFGSNILASGASIYCTKKAEFLKNHEILRGWDISESEFINYFNQELDLELLSVTDATSKQSLGLIKKFSNTKIAEIINNNRQISDFIFFGIGNFEEPFTAHWLFEHGEFKPNYIIPFTVTTGSGRSKGIYTLVLKPKN